MRKLIAVTMLMSATTLFAEDVRTKFLYAYVDALCAEKHGAHQKAVDTIEPFANDVQMRAVVNDAKVHQYTDASIQASWALVSKNWSTQQLKVNVSRRDREQALATLKECFGDWVVAGPKDNQPDLRKGAAAFAWFLQYPVDPVMHPRGGTPGNHGDHR